MNKKLFLLNTITFLFSFAMAQSQVLKGTIVPLKKKSIVILPTNKKDSIETAIKQAAPIPQLKSPIKVQSALQGLDTTIKTNNTIGEPVKTNLKSQYLKGTITADNGNPILLKPVPADSSTKNISQPTITAVKINNPLDVLDTTLIVAEKNDVIKKYGLPPEHNTLRPQTITGTLIAKPGAAVNIVPISGESVSAKNMDKDYFPLYPPERNLVIDSSGTIIKDSVAVINKDPMKNVLDGLDTTKMVYDPTINISSAPFPPSTYRSQIITSGTFVANKGEPVRVEPIRVTPDSLKQNNGESENQIGNQIIDNSIDSSATSSSKLVTNFFVNQLGTFSVHFATDKFYFNISQTGKVIDFEILSNGKITSNVGSKIIQVGNIKVDYNTDGSVASIAGIHIAYTYDGKVNRVGDLTINYSINGIMEKVADLTISYNFKNAVEKIGPFRVGYDSKQMVIGIDDSNGLVVFKPIIK